MRKHFLPSGLAAISWTAFAQIDSVDFWIAKINNNQLSGTCHYFWTPEVENDADEVFKLIEYGKSSSDKLITQLTTDDRGIISHFILSIIWQHLEIETEAISGDEIKYRINGLEFFELRGQMMVSKDNLIKAKAYWIRKTKRGQ